MMRRQYEVVMEADGRAYITRCDGAGEWEEIAAYRDPALAHHLVEKANAGEIGEIDLLYEETGKPDSAFAIVWIAVLAIGVAGLWGLWRLGVTAWSLLF